MERFSSATSFRLRTIGRAKVAAHRKLHKVKSAEMTCMFVVFGKRMEGRQSRKTVQVFSMSCAREEVRSKSVFSVASNRFIPSFRVPRQRLTQPSFSQRDPKAICERSEQVRLPRGDLEVKSRGGFAVPCSPEHTFCQGKPQSRSNGNSVHSGITV